MTESKIRSIAGLHHVTLPVSDVARSRDWYTRVFDLVPILDEEDESDLASTMLEHPVTGLLLRLQRAPDRARAFARFTAIAFAVESREALVAWWAAMSPADGDCTSVEPAHPGWSFTIADPDGIRVELRTREAVSADPD